MRSLPLLILALPLTVLVGCKAVDAMDATESMKKDLASMKDTTGGMATTTDGMKSTTDELKRKASIGEGIKLLDAPENNREYAPPSKGLLTGAKLIAENMSSQELISFIDVGLKEINKTVADDMDLDPSLLGGYQPRFVAEFNKRKEVQIVALKAIAAQIPQAMVEKIIAEQIHGAGGAQANATRTMLMLRAMFLDDFFLASSIFADDEALDNVGKLRKAFIYASQLQFIASLSFADKILFKTSDITFLPPVYRAQKVSGEVGCQTPEELKNNHECKPTLGTAKVINETLRLDIAKPWFNEIVKRITPDSEGKCEMPEEFRNSASPYAREITEILEASKRYAAVN